MIAFKKAIYERLRDEIMGRLHWDYAPTGTPFPFIVVQISNIGEPDRFQVTREIIDTLTVRISVCDATMESVDRLIENIEEVFVNEELLTDTGQVMDIARGSMETFQEPQTEPSAGEIWHGVIDLVITYQHRLGE